MPITHHPLQPHQLHKLPPVIGFDHNKGLDYRLPSHPTHLDLDSCGRAGSSPPTVDCPRTRYDWWARMADVRSMRSSTSRAVRHGSPRPNQEAALRRAQPNRCSSPEAGWRVVRTPT